MRVAVSNVSKILAEFINTEVVPKAENSLSKFGLALSSSYIASNAAGMLDQYMPLLKSIGIVDAQNFIDLDKAKEHAAKAMVACNNHVDVMGYIANSDDVVAIYNIAKRYGV